MMHESSSRYKITDLIVLNLFKFSHYSANVNRDMSKTTFTRLSKNVYPIHYKIRMKIDIEKCEFIGSVEADLMVNVQFGFIQ